MPKKSKGDSPLPPVKLALFTAFNAMVVHQALSISGRADAEVEPLSVGRGVPEGSFKAWLVDQWVYILATANHEPVFDLALKVLEETPAHPQIERVLRQLARAAESIVGSKALLKHDISGRLYHRLLLRDVAKGLATYYTSIPAAHLLARLAVESPGIRLHWENGEKPPIVADLACGSGTLLSAAYTALLDEWTQRELGHGSEVDDASLLQFHQGMLQSSLFGFDVLEYATHLAASWLTLRLPEAEVRKMNIYTLPLGGPGEPWLGSLSATVRSDSVSFAQARALTGDAVGGGTAASPMERRTKPVRMPRPNLILMNPPYARTGNVGKSILLGHLPPDERKRVLEGLKGLANRIRSDLGESAGNAGLAPMFVWLAGKAASDSGRLSFVLPRALFGGVFWEVIREFLLERFRIDHLVICYDPSYSWAWSENTDLSEVLLVASRKDGLDPAAVHEDARVTYVYNRPRSGLEGKILAGRILELSPEPPGRSTQIAFGKRHIASTYRVPQTDLSRFRTWNVPIGFASEELNRAVVNLVSDSQFLGHGLPCAPLAKLLAHRQEKRGGKVASVPLIGYDVSPYSRHIRRGGPVELDALEGANEDTLGKLLVNPNSLVHVAGDDTVFPQTASNLLIVGVARFWLFTSSLLAVTTTRPAVSNALWTIRLRGPDKGFATLDAHRAQALWLNSTPGLLGMLSMRQDNKGAFVQLKKEYVPLIPGLAYDRIGPEGRAILSRTFNELGRRAVPNIPEQLRQARTGKGFRCELDAAVLKAMGVEADQSALIPLYSALLKETVIAPPDR